MYTALRDFGDRLRQQGGVGLFYFAGHGVQVKGKNYLIPIGADIQREDEVGFQSLDANLVLEKLDSAGNRFNIVILDACRNNPFARSFRSVSQGLAQMDAPAGPVIAFTTSTCPCASDGAGRNGLYTQHLVESIHQPGLKIEEVFKQVRASVRRDSAGKQTPWESTSLEGEFYFHPISADAIDLAQRRSEQERIDAAVQAAMQRERERLRKEFEEARTQSGAAQIPPPATEKQTTQSTGKAPAGSSSALQQPPVVGNVAAKLIPPSGDEVNSARVIGSQIPGKVEAPQFAVGDQWEWVSIDSQPFDQTQKAAPTFVRVTVTGVNAGTITLSRATLDKPGGTSMTAESTYTVNSALETSFDRDDTIRGSRKDIEFPLDGSTRWSNSYELSRAGSSNIRDSLDCKVLGWETVTVPAGTFWAIKIEQKGWWNDLGARGVGQVLVNQSLFGRKEMTAWYSPEVKYFVKSIVQTYAAATSLGTGGLLPEFARTVELVRFRNSTPNPTTTAK
jgi:uncharacterized caspase-like protein